MRVLTFGEAMLRFTPPADSSLEKAERFAVEIAGAEANVAIALARLGFDAQWVSRLPRNALGRRVAAKIREHGVDVSRVVWTDSGRVGLYFVEIGAPPRPPHVIYDRADSSFASMTPQELDQRVLEGVDLLHLTGITPALGPGCREAMRCLIHWARERGVPISFDLNYRAKLWSVDEARALSESVFPLLRFLFISSDDASMVLGLEGAPDEPAEAGVRLPAETEVRLPTEARFRYQVQELGARYPNATVVLTAGEAGAWAWDGSMHHRPAVPGGVVDRIGRGDAFCAGYLFGQSKGGPDLGLACGTALASLAQTYTGDIAWITQEDVLALATDTQAARYR